MANSIEVIINSNSGARRAREMKVILERILARSGRTYGVTISGRDSLSRVIDEKAATDCEILVAAGGDGTASALAKVALERGKVLGVLPLGTFNYFARSLDIPLDLEAAARVILEGRAREVPVLDLDGRLVLNNTSIGILSAALLRRRELYRRWGRSQLNTYLSVLLTLFQAPPRLRVRLVTAQGELERRTPMVMICSSAFQMENFALAGKECLQANQFAVYVARLAGRLTLFRLGLRTLLRRLRAGIDYEVICVSDVTIERLKRRRFRATIDGELEPIESPMRVRMNPRRLSVMAARGEAIG